VIAITITAILASIGTEIISTVYQNYIQTRSITKLEAQTELAITQISKRLQYRIKQTLVGYEKNKNKYKDITDCKEDCGIAWYMQSYESRRLGEANKTGWSGVINKATIARDEINLSPGYGDDDVQNLEKVKEIIESITSKEVSKENRIALIFKQSEDKASENYYNGNTNKVYKAYFSGNDLIIDKNNENKDDKLEDLYYLSHTINRIYIDGDKNLKLDVIPATSPSTKANENNSYIIAKNVTTLRFTNFASENNFVGSNGLILKICIKDPNLKVGKKENDQHLEVCKVKAII
ncbi:MAG: hypothetical protein ACOCMW_05980, partial [Campylobacter hyointestinalis]